MDHTDFELVAFRHEPALHRALWAAAASVEDCRQTFPVQVNPVVKTFPPINNFRRTRPLLMIMVEIKVKQKRTCSCFAVISLLPRKTKLRGICSKAISCTCTIRPNVIKPTRAFAGRTVRQVSSDSWKKKKNVWHGTIPNSAEHTFWRQIKPYFQWLKIVLLHARVHNEQKNRRHSLIGTLWWQNKIGKEKSNQKMSRQKKQSSYNRGLTGRIYSMVVNCGISSAGRCCSLIALYCGGNCGGIILMMRIRR